MLTIGVDELYCHLFDRITFELDYCGGAVAARNHLSGVAQDRIDWLTEIEGYLLHRRMRAVRAAGG